MNAAMRNTVVLDPRAKTFLGYHTFPKFEAAVRVEGHGSFEVFHRAGFDPDHLTLEPGYYWWVCHPGCLPDSEPHGPFPTAEGAYLDAIGD